MNACTDSANGDNGRMGRAGYDRTTHSDHNRRKGTIMADAILKGDRSPVKVTPRHPAGTASKGMLYGW